jgi:hypothetical protein
MKKTFLKSIQILVITIILIATCTFAMAQPRAIGGRLGYNIGISYQHQIGEKNMIQADVDLIAYALHGIQGTVTYNWIVPLKSWEVVKWNLIAGVGAGAGFQWWGGHYTHLDTWPLPYREGGTFLGAAGMIGMEWNFKFPLQLAIEYRPLVGTILHQKRDYYDDHFERKGIAAAFYYRGLWESAAAISVRYKFGEK